MKSQGKKFLIITDNTSFIIGGPRYLGPYRIAHELENHGIQTFVIDKFYSIPNFFEFLEAFLDESFIGFGISTTFFSPLESLKSIDRLSHRQKRFTAYYEHGIISADPDDRKLWFTQLKNILQKKSPKAKIFIGGSKAQFFYHGRYNNLDEIDYLVMGVVDLVFPQVLKDLINGKEPVYKMIGNKKVIDTANHYKQPRSCPPHKWKKHWFVQPGEALPIEIGRGCAFNCKFCNYEKNDSARKSLSDLKSEIIDNYEQYGVQYYHFVDDCFNDSRIKVEEVCNMLLSLPFKIEWVSYLRFDVALRFPETADLIVASGGRGFHWGVESLTHVVARKAGKGADSEKIKEFIINFSKKYKDICYSTGSFISGLPGETEESWEKQIDWLIETENFDFVLIGPLGVANYQSEFDGSIVDYADYSRNPSKYGFTEVNITNSYWKHETMDSFRARELADNAMKRWEEKIKDRNGIVSGIWLYPLIRSLGFSPSETRDFYFSSDKTRQQELISKARPRVQERMKNYLNSINQLKDFSEKSAFTTY